MTQIHSFGLTAEHAKSLAEWIRDDEVFCSILVGTDRVVVASVADTVAEVCEVAEGKVRTLTENTYDHNLCKDVNSHAEHVIATIYTLNHIPDSKRWIASPESLQHTVSDLLDAARTLRMRKAQIDQIVTEQQTQQTAAPKQRAKPATNRRQ